MADPLKTRSELGGLADYIARRRHEPASGAETSTAVARLRTLGDDLQDGKRADEWVGIDFFQAFDVDGLSDELHASDQMPGLIRAVETLRNVLILAPVLVTWFGISQAVDAYHNMIDGIIAAGQRGGDALPFLYLWESGFNRQLPWWLTLSKVALWDSVLILLVLFLTLAVYAGAHTMDTRRHAQAAAFRQRLKLALADAARCLRVSQHSRAEGLAEDFADVAGRLVDEIKDEHARLERAAETREREVTALRDFSSDLLQGATTLKAAADELLPQQRRIAEEVGALARAIETIRVGQTELADVGRDASARLEQLLQDEHSRGAELRDAIDDLTTSARSLATSAGQATTTLDATAGLQERLSTALADATGQILAATDRVGQVSAAVLAAIGELTAVTHTHAVRHEGLATAIDTAVQVSRELAAEQRAVVESVREVTGQIRAEVASLDQAGAAILAATGAFTETAASQHDGQQQLIGVLEDAVQQSRELNDQQRAFAEVTREAATRIDAANLRLEQAGTAAQAASAELTQAVGSQTGVQQELAQAMAAAAEQSTELRAEQQALKEAAQAAAQQLATFVADQQSLVRGLVETLEHHTATIGEVGPAIATVATVAQRIGQAETALLGQLSSEHAALSHVATVVARAATALELTLRRIEEHEKHIFALVVDLGQLNDRLPTMGRQVHASLHQLLEVQERAAERLDQAGDSFTLTAAEIQDVTRDVARLVSGIVNDAKILSASVRDGAGLPGNGASDAHAG